MLMLDPKYVAGLFDGEGCVSIFAYSIPTKCRAKYSWRIMISFGMIHRPIIDLLYKNFGGYRRVIESKDSTRRRHFQWKVGGEKAALFLALIQPHVIVKKEEVDFALMYCRDPELRLPRGVPKTLSDKQFAENQAKHTWYKEKLSLMKKGEYSSRWDDGEFGEQPMPDSEKNAEGQPRAKQTALKAVGRV